MAALSPIGAIQDAIYQRAAADTELGAAVYDGVPEGAAYPYVVIGEATETPANRHGGFGRSTTHTLHVWSKHRGFSEATAIQNRLVELFDHQPMALPAPWTVLMVAFEFAQAIRDPDPAIRHVPVRFRVLTEQE